MTYEQAVERSKMFREWKAAPSRAVFEIVGEDDYAIRVKFEERSALLRDDKAIKRFLRLYIHELEYMEGQLAT